MQLYRMDWRTRSSAFSRPFLLGYYRRLLLPLASAPLHQLFEPLARALLCGRAGAGGLLLVPAEPHQLFGGELLLAPGLQDVANIRRPCPTTTPTPSASAAHAPQPKATEKPPSPPQPRITRYVRHAMPYEAAGRKGRMTSQKPSKRAPRIEVRFASAPSTDAMRSARMCA